MNISIDQRKKQFDDLLRIADKNLLSGFVSYANERSLLTFACSKCNTPHKKTAYEYISGDTICHNCIKSEDNNLIDQFREKHGSYYEYIDVNNQTSIHDTITIVCPKHGKLQMVCKDHLNGIGCFDCSLENSSHTNELSTLFNRSNHVHKFRYIYDKIKSTQNEEITVTCPKHGDFQTTFEKHLDGDGCPICTKSYKVLKKITDKLDEMNIVFSTEKTFSGCQSEQGRALHFDIYIPQKHLCIEYDSAHHFEPTKYKSNVTDEQAQKFYNIQISNDHIKSEYCKNNNISLVRIPWSECYPDVVIQEYVQNLPNKRHIYTWLDFQTDINRIVSHIKTYNYSKFAVYGVARGGVPFSVHISNHFDNMCQHGMISFSRYEGNDKTVTPLVLHKDPSVPIFIIDDLTSSGITMNKSREYLQQCFPGVNIHPIVIFGNHNDWDVFYIRPHPQQWVVFPYEV